MKGIGQLTIRTEAETIATLVIEEGGSLAAHVNGRPFRFDLVRAPGLDAFDIRHMTVVQIAEFLHHRLREEATAAEDEAEREGYEG